MLQLTGFGQGSPPLSIGASPTGPSEERMVEQALPRSEPTRTPGPSEQAVGVGDDCGAVSPQVLRGETVPLPIVGEEARSRSRSCSWTSASRCPAPSYSWIRRVPSIRRSTRAMKRPRSSKISCCGVTGISAAWCSTRMIDSHADSLRASSIGMTRRSRVHRVAAAGPRSRGRSGCSVEAAAPSRRG